MCDPEPFGRVVQAFDLAGHSQHNGYPVLRVLCEGRETEMLERTGRSRPAAAGAVKAVWYDKRNSTGIIAAHPFGKLRAGSCKKRKDGARIIKGRPFRSRLRLVCEATTKAQRKEHPDEQCEICGDGCPPGHDFGGGAGREWAGNDAVGAGDADGCDSGFYSWRAGETAGDLRRGDTFGVALRCAGAASGEVGGVQSAEECAV
jgi:hypothetical protein